MSSKAVVVNKKSATSSQTLIRKILRTGVAQGLIIETLMPWLAEKYRKHPRLVKTVLLPLTMLVLASGVMKVLPPIRMYLLSHFMCSLTIPEDDQPLLDIFEEWLREKKSRLIPEQSVTACTPGEGRYMPDEGDKVLFVPRSRWHIFTHEKRIFIALMEPEFGPVEGDTIIWTIGLSAEPIQRLLRTITHEAQYKEKKITSIIGLRSGSSGRWEHQRARVSRPLDTIYLPASTKEDLVKDMDEFFSEEAKQWYDDHSVPYRRGYLLAGRSGAGKSSLAMAVAAHFNLPVYMLSLHNKELDDARLAKCMLAVPLRCMLLIEDVDAAIDWDRDLDEEDTETPSTEEKASGKMKDARKKKRADEDKSSVSLSGLLNAIDGPVAPEGHVLFMTTNCPKKLDPALIRPGRVDVRIDFKNADKDQVKNIFMAMYKPRDQTADSQETSKSETKPELTAEEVLTMAESFAQKVPEYVLSTAQLQDYFLLHKKKPQDALDGLDAWLKLELDKIAKDGASSRSETESVGSWQDLGASTASGSESATPVKSGEPVTGASIIGSHDGEGKSDESVQVLDSTKKDLNESGSPEHSGGEKADELAR
jgi:hypothetical protein